MGVRKRGGTGRGSARGSGVETLERLPPNPEDGRIAFVPRDYRAENDIDLLLRGIEQSYRQSWGYADGPYRNPDARQGGSLEGAAGNVGAVLISFIEPDGTLIVYPAGGNVPAALWFGGERFGLRASADGRYYIEPDIPDTTSDDIVAGIRLRIERVDGKFLDRAGNWVDRYVGPVTKKGYYRSIDGEWKPLGGAAGGIPAAKLPERGDEDNGIFFGLQHPGAGVDWVLIREARQHVDVQATVTLGPGDPQMVVTMPATKAVGADGNGWTIRHGALGNNVSARFDDDNREIIIAGTALALTYTAVAAALNALSAGMAVLSGNNQNNRLADSFSANFAGGLSQQTIAARLDEATKTVHLRYHTDDTQAEVIAQAPFHLGDGSLLHAKLIGESTPATRLVVPDGSSEPFDRFFSEGSLPLLAPDRLGLEFNDATNDIEMTLDDAVIGRISMVHVFEQMNVPFQD